MFLNTNNEVKKVDLSKIIGKSIIVNNNNAFIYDNVPGCVLLDQRAFEGEEKEEIKEDFSFTQQKRKRTNKDEKPKQDKKKGRKKISDIEKGVHDKNTDDNLIKRSINIIRKVILRFINKKISKTYQKKVSLKNIGPTKNKIEDNKKLLDTPIKEIFSANISKRFKHFDGKYNERKIDQLLNEENESIRGEFVSLFNLTFSDFLSYFIKGKDEMPPLLDGMETLDDILKQFEDKEYKEKFKNFVLKLESNIEGKKGRNREKIQIII